MLALPDRKNKYDGTLEFWCDTGLTGERVQTERTTQREVVSKEEVCQEAPKVEEGNSSWNLSSMLDEKEQVTEDDAKQAQVRSKMSSPKLEEEQPVICLH